MTIKQLMIIKALIENRFNVSVTAKKLHMVQSAISHHIRSLEEELGGWLFERKGRRLVGTTPLCDRIIPKIELLLEMKDQIEIIGEEHTEGIGSELYH